MEESAVALDAAVAWTARGGVPVRSRETWEDKDAWRAACMAAAGAVEECIVDGIENREVGEVRVPLGFPGY
jgi:hypothetical protein